VSWTILTSDATSGSTTTYAVQDDTGWLTGDTVYISSTDPSDGAKAAELTLSGDAGTNSIPATTASANYEGTWPIPAVLAADEDERDHPVRQLGPRCVVYRLRGWRLERAMVVVQLWGRDVQRDDIEYGVALCLLNNKAATLTTWNFAVTGTVGGNRVAQGHGVDWQRQHCWLSASTWGRAAMSQTGRSTI